MGEHVGVDVADAALDDAFLDVADRVGEGDLLAPAQRRREPLLGGGELEQVARGSRCSSNHAIDARMPSSIRRDGVGLVGDRLLLAPAQVLLRVAQDLEEQLLLAGEVPVEDALADAEARHDLGDGRGVVAVLGESGRGERHELLAALASPLGQPAVHAANGKQHLTDRSRTPTFNGRTPGRNRAVHSRVGTVPPMQTYVVRVWLPDRPGALGAVASRIGAVRGDVVGIDILERGAGRAIDELVVELPDGVPVDLLVSEIGQVDGVDVEDVRPVAESGHDPRSTPSRRRRCWWGRSRPSTCSMPCASTAPAPLGAAWAAVVDVDDGFVLASVGPAPPRARGSPRS